MHPDIIDALRLALANHPEFVRRRSYAFGGGTPDELSSYSPANLYTQQASSSAPTNSAPMNSAPMNSAPMNSAPMNSAPMNSAPMNSAPTNSNQQNQSPNRYGGRPADAGLSGGQPYKWTPLYPNSGSGSNIPYPAPPPGPSGLLGSATAMAHPGTAPSYDWPFPYLAMGQNQQTNSMFSGSGLKNGPSTSGYMPQLPFQDQDDNSGY